ncbi:MAG: alanine--tRNA ligase-related protein, partial [Planctomycetota bacterium]
TDHARACTFAIHENVYPGPKDAKYVVKRLIRRAVLDGYQMGLREPFLFKLVPAVAESAKAVYPELGTTIERVSVAIESEERNFFGTIDGGMKRISQLFEQMREEDAVMVPGAEAADMNKTYGVPPELLQTIAAEQNFTFDWAGYNETMDQHAIDSGAGQKELFQTGPLETLKEALRETPFLGYDKTEANAIIKGIITGGGRDGDEGQLLSHVDRPGENEFRLILDHSPFYGESGGQIGDTGVITSNDFEFEVRDTQKHGGLIVHHGKLTRGEMKEGVRCTASVDTQRRDSLARAHSATHILHHALHVHVGDHAQQQGSKVEEDRLRFDFTNQKPIPDEVLAKIESDVVTRVGESAAVKWETLPLSEARAAGAMMLFGEKYPDPVRMVSIGDYSKELCAGTHVGNTGDVASFELMAEESVSAGTRRIVALTGGRAEEHREHTTKLLGKIGAVLGTDAAHAAAATTQLMEEVRQLRKELNAGNAGEYSDDFKVASGAAETGSQYVEVRSAVRDITRSLNVSQDDVLVRIESLISDREKLIDQLRKSTAGGKVTADDLIGQGEQIGEDLVVVAEVPGANPNVMRGWIDQIRKKSSGGSAVLLATTQADKVLLVGGLSRSLVERGLKAGQWVGDAAKMVGGGGGGRPDMAQAGGKDPSKLPEALQAALANIKQQLGS